MVIYFNNHNHITEFWFIYLLFILNMFKIFNNVKTCFFLYKKINLLRLCNIQI